MKNYQDDRRCVLTLDAGGTNFVYSAIRGYREITDTVRMSAEPNNLKQCLDNIIGGFKKVQKQLNVQPDAISFAFPGPADYKSGIIGNLPNFPAFKGDVALGPLLEEELDLPVYINNDGRLFALGEAVHGFKPYVNHLLEQHNITQRYRNLIGITIGTGLGGGIVCNGVLCDGDNFAGGEVWLFDNKRNPGTYAEEGASIRAVQHRYAMINKSSQLKTPKEIYEIGIGERQGNVEAAKKAYRELGEVAGNVIANTVTLIDGLVVIGGGLAKAHELFFPALLNELNGTFKTSNNKLISRLDVTAFNLKEEEDKKSFLDRKNITISIPGSDKTVSYDPTKRIAVGTTQLGTSKAVAIGAYHTALQKLDNGC